VRHPQIGRARRREPVTGSISPARPLARRVVTPRPRVLAPHTRWAELDGRRGRDRERHQSRAHEVEQFEVVAAKRPVGIGGQRRWRLRRERGAQRLQEAEGVDRAMGWNTGHRPSPRRTGTACGAPRAGRSGRAIEVAVRVLAEDGLEAVVRGRPCDEGVAQRLQARAGAGPDRNLVAADRDRSLGHRFIHTESGHRMLLARALRRGPRRHMRARRRARRCRLPRRSSPGSRQALRAPALAQRTGAPPDRA